MSKAIKCRLCGAELSSEVSSTQCDRCTIISQHLLRSDLTSEPASVPEVSPTAADDAGIEFGDYLLLNEIGRGGMGSVFRAKQRSLNRIVALKRPLSGVVSDEARIRRFRTEAEAVAALSHPNIIAVFECGEYEGEQYFSMAYIEGENLSEISRRKDISPARAARYVKIIAEAIHHAHQRGVLHRDLKPANIIIDASDEPRIADFGLARLLRGDRDELDIGLAGTANYMAPEQVVPGNRPASVATDVYALGGILYHLLTGKPPFEGKSQSQIFWSAYYEEPVPPTRIKRRLSRDLEAICLKALEKSPEKRYSSAQAMAEDLEKFIQHRPVSARPVSPIIALLMWVRRNAFFAGMLFLLITSVATGIVLQCLAFRNIRIARAASEGFIGFMNADLVHDLRDAGRLDLMEKVNGKAEDYYTNYTAIADSGYWERKAMFFENMADVEVDLGEPAKAEIHAMSAEAIYRQQQELEPGESRWKRNQSRVRLLRMRIASGVDLGAAANSHGTSALALASEALELAPNNATNKVGLAKVLVEQANILIRQKRTEASATNIAHAEALCREATLSPVSNPEWFLDLAKCAYYRGLIQQLRKNTEGALFAFNEYQAMVQTLVHKNPRHTRWQFELTVAYARVGEAKFNLKQYAQAQDSIHAFEASARNLTHIDPRNAAWLSLYARSLTWQGSVARALDSSSKVARDYFRASLSVQSNLVVRNPDWDNWLDATALTTFELATWYVGQGERDSAITVLAAWREQCEERIKVKPEAVGHQLRFGRAILAESDLFGQLMGREYQIAHLQNVLTQFVAAPLTHPCVLAKARVMARLAELCDAGGNPRSAAMHLYEALNLRTAYCEHAPFVAKVREQIADNFRFTVHYLLKAGDRQQALKLAQESLEWAQKHLLPEEWRLDYARLCLGLVEAENGSDAGLTKTTVGIVSKCLAERLPESSELSTEERQYAQRLRTWLVQHP